MTSAAPSRTDRSRKALALDREVLAPLLLRRFDLVAPPILIGTGAFAVMHILFREQQLALLLALKALQAGVTLGGLWIANRQPTRRVIVGALLALAITVNVVTAVTGNIIGNVHTNALLFVACALATSSFLPWGPYVQTLSVLSAGAAAIGPLFLTEAVTHAFLYDLVALVVAFAISIYIAREVENDTLAEYRAQTTTMALAESRADFEGIFRSSNVLIALIERDGDDFVFIDANDALAKQLEFATQRLVGMRWREVGFSEEMIGQWMVNLARCEKEGSLQVPEYRLDFLQPPRWYHVSVTAIRSEPGVKVRFSAVGVDITELKRASENIRRLNLDLEAQVRERTAMLEAANKDLESFAYSVSHDLRTPLRTIEGFAQLLADDHSSELSAAAVEQLGKIRGASRHMAQLISDMLMLSRASRAEIRREPVDVTLLVRGIVSELRASNEDRNPDIEIDTGLIANADTQLLRIVLNNLIGNALKYTGRRDAPQIRIGSEIHEGESVFFVSDNGCGFDMRFVGKLFQPFQRLHAPQDYEGTGVGLATVARIVRRHGGKVWAEGHLDRGAVFRFTMGDTGAVNPS